MSNDVNFKRLDELEVIESSAENAHVLAEVNGVPKRIPASSVGGGSNMVEKVLFEEPGMVFEQDPSGGGLCMGMRADSGFEFVEGKTYNVEIDGTVHVCETRLINLDEDTPGVVVGNASFFSSMIGTQLEDTGEPFVAMVYNDMIQMVVSVPGDTHSIKVSTMVEKTSGGMMRVNITMNDDETYSADKTYAEILEAIESGIMPYCVLNRYVLHLYHSMFLSDVAYYGAMPDAHEFVGFNPELGELPLITINVNDRVIRNIYKITGEYA